MVCGCAVQLCFWICFLFTTTIFIGFLLTVWEASTANSDFCTRTQLLLGVECAKKTRRLEDALMKINKTTRYLRPPSEYKKVVDLCRKAEQCLSGITCEDGQDFVQDILDTYPACEFYKFYSGDFDYCARKLMKQTSNSTCLDILFNSKHFIKHDRCGQWIDIQPCVFDAISTECDEDGNSTQLASQFAELSPDFYRAMNCDPKPQRIDSNDVDYEIIGMIEE